MKYVRTKNGIREIIHDNGNSCAVKSNHWTTIDGFTVIFGLTYAPRADRIEELCDEIVIRRNEEPYYSNSPIGKSKSWKAYQPLVKEIKDIYGAIWTDKGLIYVAKMNSEGELELL